MPEYVYGIIDSAGAAPATAGVGGAPVRTLAGEGAAALVSELPAGELRLGREDMLAHAHVLEAAVSEGTVLPLRFGVVMEADEVRERLLAARGEELADALRELDGKVELNVRVLYEQDDVMRELVVAEPEIAALRARIHGRPADATYYQRIELGELVAAALERRRTADADALLRALESVSLAVRVGESAHERMVLSASFLVARERVAEFDAVLEREAAARVGRMRFKCVGPLAPHSFLELTAAG